MTNLYKHILKVLTPKRSASEVMGNGDKPSFDINNYYARVPVCRTCGNICGKDDLQCGICGCTSIVRRVVCKSMYRHWECSNTDCGYRALSHISVCPACGAKLRSGPICMIYEDHVGLPIPDIKDCTGELKEEYPPQIPKIGYKKKGQQ